MLSLPTCPDDRALRRHIHSIPPQYIHTYIHTVDVIKACTVKLYSILRLLSPLLPLELLGFAEEGTDLLLGVILLGIVVRNYLTRTKDDNEMAS
jgi:hypothetical protein